ncbi:hypothetical protein PFY10_10140 [Chryseobacterium daecheongense]|nr:hypothetical protein PFY10_10140 [Chryseobacterium daecheongense]
MKKLILVMLMITASFSYAQSLQIYTGKRDFLPIEILMEDGSIKKGFAQDFTLPDPVTFSIQFIGKTSAKGAHLDRKEIKFKSSKTDPEIQLIPVTVIKSLIYTNEDTHETFQLDKRIVRKINNNLELESEGKVLMLPLIKKGDINLYGFRNIVCKANFGDSFATVYNGNENNCSLVAVMTYISKPDDTVAISPADYDSVTPFSIFNLKNIYKKYYKAYELIGKDCPEFLKKVDQARSEDYFSNKTFKENKKALEEEKKEALRGKKGVEITKLNLQFSTELYTKMYGKLIEDYQESCH